MGINVRCLYENSKKDTAIQQYQVPPHRACRQSSGVRFVELDCGFLGRVVTIGDIPRGYFSHLHPPPRRHFDQDFLAVFTFTVLTIF